ncbi:MAG: beta-ketoacyl synthase chain length factor [Gammaproteobacteria bacterium]
MKTDIAIKSVALCGMKESLPAGLELEINEPDKSLLPASIRRRTALTTRMAVTAAVKACESAGVDTKSLPSVFASVGGEIRVTDALCRTLPAFDEMLSPTQFHNSVHNTTAGYWGIMNGCRAPTTAIAAVDDTFAMGLLESWSQLMQNPGNLLLVCYDEDWPQYLAPPMGKIPFACALVLESRDAGNNDIALARPVIENTPPELEPGLVELIERAPAAACIPLLRALDEKKEGGVPLNIKAPYWHTHLRAD